MTTLVSESVLFPSIFLQLLIIKKGAHLNLIRFMFISCSSFGAHSVLIV